MPSSVSSSFFTRILIGSRINFFVTSKTSAGMVADSRTTLKRFTEISVSYKQSSYFKQGSLARPLRRWHQSSNLDVARQLLEDLVDLILESSTKHLISLVQHEHFDVFRSCKKREPPCYTYGHITQPYVCTPIQLIHVGFRNHVPLMRFR